MAIVVEFKICKESKTIKWRASSSGKVFSEKESSWNPITFPYPDESMAIDAIKKQYKLHNGRLINVSGMKIPNPFDDEIPSG